MPFKSPLEAGRDARAKREEIVGPSVSDASEPSRGVEIDRNSQVYKLIFELQGEIEKEGGMNYQEYARRFWHKVAGNDASVDGDPFHIFERNLIGGLHDIPMRKFVYEHVLRAMPALVEQYKDSIAHLSLWSKGDVSATGYQDAKIESSRILHKFMREVAEQVPKETRRIFLKQKTSYDVADDKFENLVHHVEQALQTPDDQVKVVIIEDSYKNFEAAKQAIEHVLGKEITRRVNIEPIWAVYSREGINAQTKEGVPDDAFRKKHAHMHPIKSFEELADKARFGDLFKDAHVFLDFDGVVADNLRTRDAQANVTLTAAIDGLSQEWKLEREATRERIEKI